MTGQTQAALDFTVDYCKNHRFEPAPTLLAESLMVQSRVAEMTMAMDSARLILYQSASQWADAGFGDRAVLSARAKYIATQAALSVSSMAIQTVGGRSAHKRMPLERIFRDIRTCTLMPPNMDQATEIIGKAELGLLELMMAATPQI